jgi:hypothetical protein
MRQRGPVLVFEAIYREYEKVRECKRYLIAHVRLGLAALLREIQVKFANTSKCTCQFVYVRAAYGSLAYARIKRPIKVNASSMYTTVTQCFLLLNHVHSSIMSRDIERCDMSSYTHCRLRSRLFSYSYTFLPAKDKLSHVGRKPRN